MKKLFFILMALAGTALNAQISRPNTDTKVNEFTKLVTSYTNGQRVDKTKLAALYNEINCMLTEPQAEALNIDLQNSREDVCGSSVFPRTQALTDATFKRYAGEVKAYLDYKAKVGDK